MGNCLWCFKGEEDHGGGGGDGHYPYYCPTSRPHYKPRYYSDVQPPAAALPRPYHQQDLDPYGVTAATAGIAMLAQGVLNFEPISMAPEPNIVHLQRSSELPANKVVAPHTVDIDESSAHGLCAAKTYAKVNAMLIQVPVLGTMKTFWRLSDKATRISRKLALILRAHHSVGKYIAAPLKVSNVWISNSGSVKLSGGSFTDKDFSIKRVRDDYKHMSRVLRALIRISGGDITKLPPDYNELLTLLGSKTLAMKDEFLIVNNSALLPLKNQSRPTNEEAAEEEEKEGKKILSELPYKEDWLNTARANTQINQWVIHVSYNVTQLDQLRLNRNVRSHMHQYNDDDIEEILYCEWPELLMAMQKKLHMEGGLQGCDIENKFG
ncbi:hypothetical protein EJB05_01588, partial [Eragrostis curvula]